MDFNSMCMMSKMNEPLLSPLSPLDKPSMRMIQSSQRLPPEFLMPVPFCELVCDKLYCVCSACLCCCNTDPWD